ncbi:hypothetical protein BDV11DRAFT_177986 [Aspergillus similis]
MEFGPLSSVSTSFYDYGFVQGPSLKDSPGGTNTPHFPEPHQPHDVSLLNPDLPMQPLQISRP